MGVAMSPHLGSWACGAKRSGLMGGGVDEEGIDVCSSASSALYCEPWLVGATCLLWCGVGANLDVGRSVRVE